ncbi:NAD(P)-dependent oxidoreductase [Streptomyces sp. NPDC050509]|uniref:NAD(P)-dependent oxidoreductase n=1 Tax=Streptomyces sp. NPDC050509 TaxID=3365620 RepID=UPI00379FD8F1
MTDTTSDAASPTDSPSVSSSASLPVSPSLTLLGLGAMGTAFARAWLAAGYPLTVWNRTPSRAEALVAEGARPAASAAEAVAASTLVVTCLLDDASVGETLEGADLTGKDLVDLTTGTPSEARTRAVWAEARGARFLSGGIMAVPPMIGTPEAGGYVLYSGSQDLFEAHRTTLAAPAGTRFVGGNPGHAALQDVALLSGMYGMLAGVAHAFALIGGEKDIAPAEFAPLLAEWVAAMSGTIPQIGEQLASGDYESGVTSSLEMQVAGIKTFLGTAADQNVSPELLTPFFDMMRRQAETGGGGEGFAGLVGLLT